MKRNNKKIRLVYLKSRYNEFYLNKIAVGLGFDKYTGYLGLHKNNALLLKYDCLYQLYAFWVFLMIPLWYCFRLCKSIVSRLKSKRSALDGSTFFLATSIALPRVTKNAGIYDMTSKWLELPWNLTNGISEEQRVSVFDVLSFSEIFFCFKEVLILLFWSVLRDGLKYVYTNIFAFDWYLYYLSVNKIPKGSKVVFCSHTDFWCSLLGSLTNFQTILVQHGTEMYLENKKNLKELKYVDGCDAWVGDFPVKYSHLDFVYVFSDKHYIALCNSVIANNPPYKVVGYGVTLTDVGNIDKKKILIIGYIKNYALQEETLLKYFQGKGVEVYLKNHPTIPPVYYEEFQRMYDFTFINSDLFPNVDIIFSYYSTLAQTYQDMGKKVVYYDDLDFSNIDDLKLSELNI